MKITITGSLGNISRLLTEKLVAAGHEVKVITSQAARKAEIEALGAKAAIGSVTDARFLQTAFAGADAIYTMVPPNLGPENIIANTQAAGRAIYAAIKQSGVKRVVQLSSIGANLPEGTGPIAGLHKVEQELSKLQDVTVTFMRAGYFYLNFYSNIPLIKNLGIMGSNWPGSAKLPLVHPEDIADAVAKELTADTQGITTKYIISDVVDANALAEEIGAALGKEDLKWVKFSDEEAKLGMEQVNLPEEIAGLYVEMGTGLRKGIIQADFYDAGATVTGRIKVKDFAAEFAKNYNNN